MWKYEEIDLAVNEFVFCYEPEPAQTASYILRHIDIYGNILYPDVLRGDYVEGETVHEYAPAISGYTVLNPEMSFEIEDGVVYYFIYMMHAPIH